MQAEYEVLSLSTIRNLNDRIYEKRKLGALEVEQLVRQLRSRQQFNKLEQLLNYLIDNFTFSSQANPKKGGLIGLAAVVIGLGRDTYRYLHLVVPAILKCFPDPDHRVRYYACEALYNVSKVGGPLVLTFFNEIFDSLCKLSADPDKSVQDGAALLNRLLHDIVRESDVFDIQRFIPSLERRLHNTNAGVRDFLIGWIRLLDSVPTVDLVLYLSQILDGLLSMLGDENNAVSREVSSILNSFLGQIKNNSAESSIEFDRLVEILVRHCDVSMGNEYTHYTALGWLNQFIFVAPNAMLISASDALSAILPSLSHEVDEIRDSALACNDSLLTLTENAKSSAIPLSNMIHIITLQFQSPHRATRLAALNWIRILYVLEGNQLDGHLQNLFPALIDKISDDSEAVVVLALQVMSKISEHEEYFGKLVDTVLSLFSSDAQLQSARGALIIRQLSLFIDPRKLFSALSERLSATEDPPFANAMAHTLSLILATAPELERLRRDLKSPDQFFVTLYRAFSHNAVATVSLCLICELYQHATELFIIIGGYEMTVDFLCEIDRLVQLIESPVFARLRLQLLEPQTHPFLFKALFALLLILPQSPAFTTLKNRLDGISHIHHLRIPASPSLAHSQKVKVDFEKLKDHFISIQELHKDFHLEEEAERKRKEASVITVKRRSLLREKLASKGAIV